LSERDVDVEALVQDTFEQALRVWDTIRLPRAWLYTVARRRLARCIPAAAVRADGEPADHSEQGTVSWSTVAPSAGAEDLVAARAVIELIRLMPQRRRREVAYLRDLEEWGFDEIAEQLGCCPSTARVQLSRRGCIVPPPGETAPPIWRGGTCTPGLGRFLLRAAHGTPSGCCFCSC
jgi:RNA polymerase sigma-70 factor (ECF subfamily)